MDRPITYSTKKAAEFLGLSTKSIQQYAARGRLQAQKVGNSWVFTEESLERFLRGDRQPVAHKALATFVPGLAAELKYLRKLLYRHADHEAIKLLDDTIRDFIAPMMLLADNG